MRYGVGRNQIFKAVEIFEYVFLNNLVAYSFPNNLKNLMQNFYKESAGAGSKIQYRDFLALRQPFTNTKGVFEYAIDGTNDKIDDRGRRVIHATLFLCFLVIGIQEVFVKIHIRVFGKKQAFLFGFLK